MEQNVARLPYFERIWAWFEVNKKQVLWGALTVIALGLIVSFYFWQEGQKETTAAEALSRVMATTAFSGASHAESPEAFLKVASQHTGTSAGAQALLLAGEALFAEGKYSEAQAQFERFRRDYTGHPLTAQALFGIATCLDAQGKTDEAARGYKEVVDRQPNASVVPQAKFRMARIYESQNKLNEARTLYEEIARVDSSMGSEAGMRLEELRKKTAAATPPLTTTSVLTNLPVKTN